MSQGYNSPEFEKSETLASPMALRCRRILPTISSISKARLTPASVAPIVPSSSLPGLLNSFNSLPVVQFHSRMFRSSPISMICSTPPETEEKMNPNDILFAGCDFNHWLITIDFSKDPKPTRDEMVQTYEQTCAKGLNIRWPHFSIVITCCELALCIF